MIGEDISIPNNTRLFIEEFIAGKEYVINLLEQINHPHKFYISKNLWGPVFLLPESNKEGFTSDELFDNLVKRWETEALYFQKIEMAKNIIENEFDNLIPFIQKEDQIILENQKLLLLETFVNDFQLDSKNKISEFCIGICSGYDNEIKQNIMEVLNELNLPYGEVDLLAFADFVKQSIQSHQIKNGIDIIIMAKKLHEYLESNIRPSFFEFYEGKQVDLNEIEKLLNSDKNLRLSLHICEYTKPIIELLQKMKKHNKIIHLKISSSIEDYIKYFLNIPSHEIHLICKKGNNFKDLTCLFPRSMKHISIDGHNLNNQQLEELGNCLSSLCLLNSFKLNLENVQAATSTGIEILVKSFYDHHFLTKAIFDLSQNNIKDEFIVHFSMSLGCLQFITYLELNFSYGANNVSNYGIIELATALNKLNMLKYFNLSCSSEKNCVTDAGLIKIIAALSKSSGLNDLLINFSGGNNQITDTSLKELARLLKELKKLKNLSIMLNAGLNSATNDGFQELLSACSYSEKQYIKRLKLEFRGAMNSVNNLNLKKFVDLSYLQYLSINLSENKGGINYNSMQDLGSCFQHLSNLATLKLSFREKTISNNDLEPLNLNFQFLKSLQNLKIDFSNSNSPINDDGFIQMVVGISSLKFILKLELDFQSSVYSSKVHISSKGVMELAEILKNYKKLAYFRLDLHGSSNQRNGLTDEGCKYLELALIEILPLKKIKIDFGLNIVSSVVARMGVLRKKRPDIYITEEDFQQVVII